jgi:hypothetical protein
VNEGSNIPSGSEGDANVVRFRARQDDATAWKTTFAIIGGVVSLLGFFWLVTNGISENLRTEVRNERIERINADNQMSATCCRRR